MQAGCCCWWEIRMTSMAYFLANDSLAFFFFFFFHFFGENMFREQCLLKRLIRQLTKIWHWHWSCIWHIFVGADLGPISVLDWNKWCQNAWRNLVSDKNVFFCRDLFLGFSKGIKHAELICHDTLSSVIWRRTHLPCSTECAYFNENKCVCSTGICPDTMLRNVTLETGQSRNGHVLKE